MSKPIVQFSAALDKVEVGRRAAVYITSPHPVLGEIRAPKWVHTSEVVAIHGDNFETLNTLYEWDGEGWNE